MKSVLFFVESLDGGGAEGALEKLVGNLDPKEWDITVVSETDGEMRVPFMKEHSHYHPFIHKNINNNRARELINRIILTGSVRLSPATVRKLYLRGKYDVEVAACEGYATKIIANSPYKNSVKMAYIHTDFVNNHWSVTAYRDAEEEKACYEKLDYIICVSESIRDSFVATYGMAEKTVVLYNIIDDKKIKAMGAEEPSIPVKEMKRPVFVLAGSFLKVKGYDRFVRAAAKLRDDGFQFSAAIMGIGYERDSIEKLIDENELQDRIFLYEYQKNPYTIFKNADAFVCSSHAEGYSTVVSESIILGKPVITTECSGMAEIFGDSKCGIICKNDEEELYLALKKVLENPALLNEFALEAEKRSNFFDATKRIEAINQFFLNAEKRK
ncbi:MAG: glycosyltransferase [Clostridia bacterium]|nr:glycosyltransferase [Clostridia bacterium]